MKTTIAWLVIGALVISNLVLGMLYFTSKDSDGVAATASSAESAVERSGNDAPEEQTPVIIHEEAQAEGVAVEDKTKFSSETSNFELSISGDYQVIVEKDGGRGGQRSTTLKIGRKNADENGSVSLGANDYVKIEAYPSDINGTRDQFVTNDTALQGNIADEASTKIDGVQVRKFTLKGVGETIKYYFEHKGNTYFIESWDVSSGDTAVMLRDVVKGFNFN